VLFNHICRARWCSKDRGAGNVVGTQTPTYLPALYPKENFFSMWQGLTARVSWQLVGGGTARGNELHRVEGVPPSWSWVLVFTPRTDLFS
jgi:hypothetical protein